jgi:cytochrome c oxidase cbb3-type subunit III
MKKGSFIKLIFFSFCWIGSIQVGLSQEGEKLFRANCSACHNIDKPSTGPALQGARSRWIENSSEEQFYNWIYNSKKVIESGDSYAIKIFNDNKESVMPAQSLTKEEIDIIFEYVENPPTPKIERETITFPREPVYVEPDYSSIFWAFVLITGILMLAIGFTASSIKTVVKSEKFRNRNIKKINESPQKPKGNGHIKTLLILIGISAAPFSASAFSFDITSSGMVKVDETDVWIFLIIDLILVWVLFYLRNLLFSLIDEISPRKKKVKQKKTRKAIKVLTRTVAVEDEASILMDHDYDGIQELDNNLPPWWLWGFYISIAAAIFYMTYYHVLSIGDSSTEAYNKEMVLAKEARAEWLKNAAMNVDENTVILFSDNANLNKGAVVFKENCKVCHGNKAEGLNGPNLTDDYWLYGGDIKTVFKSIKYGRGEEAEMPSHEEKLNPVEIQQVASYILSLDFVQGERGPEGELYLSEDTLENPRIVIDSNKVVLDSTSFE